MTPLLVGFLSLALTTLLLMLWVGNLGRSTPGFRLWGWALLVAAFALACLPAAVGRMQPDMTGFASAVFWLGLSLMLLAGLSLWNLRRLPEARLTATLGLAACSGLALMLALLLRPF